MNTFAEKKMEDAFVIGAGPSGLLMAAELLRHGLTCRIIDKSSHPSVNSKAIAVQARTLEMLTFLGITDICIEQGLKILHFRPMTQDKQLANIPLHLIESPFPFILSLEQNKFEGILIEHLKEQGCQVERQIELIDYKQEDQKVILTLRNNVSGKIDIYETKWLMGCDGAHSTVRKLMNLEFEGKSFPQIFSLADIEIEWKYPRDSGLAFINPSGLLVAFPIQDKNRFRLIFQLARGTEILKKNSRLAHGELASDKLHKPTFEEVTTIVHQYADSQAVVKNPVWTANFSINSRMVSRYCKGRAFLLGDAAHIHSPAGGQGMNTGLQDGFNLGWKIALVHKGIAKSSLLESYHEERYFVGKKLLNGTEKATNFILTRFTFLFVLRNLFISFMGSLLWVKKKIVGAISETNICYPLSDWIIQEKSRNLKLKAGMRAPEASITHLGFKTSLFNLWKKDINFKLLLINTKCEFSDLENTAFKDLEKKYKDLIKIYFINRVLYSAENCVGDVEGEVKKLYGDSTTYLIRPDGYICYCGPYPSIEILDKYLSNLLV